MAYDRNCEGRTGGARRVLIADDNSDAADTMGMYLQLFGHQVRVTYDGLEAIEAAASFCPDVVILDINMPVLNGVRVAESLRAQGSRALLVAVTVRLKQAGFDLFYVKPIDPRLLSDLLVGAQPAESVSGERELCCLQ
jgi:CheY-like chemotaxis protein